MINLIKDNVFDKAKVIKDDKILNQLLGFLVVFLLSNILQSLFSIIPLFFQYSIEELNTIMNNEEQLINVMYGSNINYLVALFSTILTIIVCILYCTKFEKRSLESMGIKRGHILKNYFIGIVLGLLMFSSVVLIEVLSNSLVFDKVNNILIPDILLLLLFFLGFMFQSASEEVMLRGYLLTSIGSKHGIFKGIIISSIMFSILHISNSSFSLMPFLNIFLVGIVFALIYICTDNIWCVCAIHCIWNFSQGNIFGIKVSGLPSLCSIFTSSQVSGHELINGGLFGAEGGIACTSVLLITILLLILYMKKKKIIDFK